MKKNILYLAILAALPKLLIAGTVDRPDAGQIINEIERAKDIISPKDQAVDQNKNTQDKAKESETQVKVEIESFTYSGNKSISNEELAQFLDKYRNRFYTLDEIKNITDELAQFYRNKGLVALVNLPEQDLSNKVLQLEIVEAKFGGVEISSENGESFVKNSIIENYINYGLSNKDSLELKQIDRKVLLINDLSGISAKSSLIAGDNLGETKIAITTKNDANRFPGSVIFDNYGSRSTGRARALASIEFNSPFKIGDQIKLVALKSQGVDFGRIDYTAPLGASGLKIGGNISVLEYDIIPDEYDSTKPSGHSATYGFNAMYPIIRSLDKNLYFTTTINKKDFKNRDITQGTASDYNVDSLSISLSGNSSDQLLGYGGIFKYDVSATTGKVNLNGSPNKTSDQATTGAHTHGNYSKLNLDLSREQFFTDNWSIFGKAQFQWADQNLDSSEKIYLGGPDGVRAYPTNEGSGADGYIANMEIRKQLPFNLKAKGFYDIGHAKQYKDNYSNTDPNSLTLKGFGLGLDWFGPYNSLVSLSVARRIGENPNKTSSGGDQDGSNKDNFVWLRGSIFF